MDGKQILAEMPYWVKPNASGISIARTAVAFVYTPTNTRVSVISVRDDTDRETCIRMRAMRPAKSGWLEATDADVKTLTVEGASVNDLMGALHRATSESDLF